MLFMTVVLSDVLAGIIVAAYHELGDHRELLGCQAQSLFGDVVADTLYRSEERRVGKECRL